jgi:hypothetical protein
MFRRRSRSSSRPSLPGIPALPGIPPIPGIPGIPGRSGRSTPPRTPPSSEIHNYRMNRGDSVAMGIINSVVPFLPVFIVRLGGSPFEVSLLTAIPAVSGFLLAIPVGQFLQGKPRIVPWYSGSRMVAHLSYAVAAVVVLLAPPTVVVPALLVVWALAAIPSTVGMVAFPIVMDGAAGPRGRFELMSRRWAIMGLTAAVTVALIGQMLDRLPFPANYQLIFVGFTLAGLVSYHYSRRYQVPEVAPGPQDATRNRFGRFRENVLIVRQHPAFLRYSLRQLVYVVGVRFAVPLIPLYYVREVGATDAWIGIIATGQSLALLVGYQLWRRVSVLRGGALVLLVTLFANALYPAVLSGVHELALVAGLTALAAVFAAGVDLALFDELMKRIPRAYGVTFASIDTALVNGASIIAPLLGATLAVAFGIEVALQVATAIGLVGVILFALDVRGDRMPGPADAAASAQL